MLDPYSDKALDPPRGAPVPDHGGLLGRIATSMGIDKGKIVDERSFKSVAFTVNRWLKHHRRKIAVGFARQKTAVIESSPATGAIFIGGTAAPRDRFTIKIGEEILEHVFAAPADTAAVASAVWVTLHTNHDVKRLVALNTFGLLIQLASIQPGSSGCLPLSVKTKGADLRITTTGDHLTLPQLLMPIFDGGFVAPNGDLLTLRKAMPIVAHDAALAKALIDSERAVLITPDDLKDLVQ